MDTGEDRGVLDAAVEKGAVRVAAWSRGRSRPENQPAD